VVLLPAPLLEAAPAVLDSDAAREGLSFMHRLAAGAEAAGDVRIHDLGGGVRLRLLRASRPPGQGGR
jgi:hypothetical protein